MDDLAASRERYPLQTMRLPDGEPFAYRYHRNPSARATIVLLPGERRLMQGLCDVLKQLLSKPYQRHMADLLIDAASHADMVTAVISRCWCAWTSTWIPYAPSSGRMRPALSRRL